MKIGFTGTRDGMTDYQKDQIRRLLKQKKPTEVCHGDCVGADADFHDIIRELFSTEECKIIIRPGPDGPNRANKHGDEILPEKSFFVRNRDIVNWCDLLVGCPKEMTHQRHGGSWYTLDYSHKMRKPTHTILPDAEFVYESL